LVEEAQDLHQKDTKTFMNEIFAYWFCIKIFKQQIDLHLNQF